MRGFFAVGLLAVLLGAGDEGRPCHDPAPFTPRTRVSLQGDRWLINGRVTNPGPRAEGRLMNVRMVNSLFEDRRKPETDPDAITDRFLARVADYASHGVNAFTLGLQGGMPGYEGAINSAFERDGSLRESYLARAGRVIEACDRQGLVVILGCYYQRQDQVLADDAAVRAGVVNVASWARRRGYRNVVLEIANEFDHDGFDHRLIRSVEGQAELIRLAKRAAPDLLVSTSGLGHGRYPESLAGAADFLLIHFNGTPLDDIPARIRALKRFEKPIICNEDAKVGEAGARAAELCVANGASWGFMIEGVNQHAPFRFDDAGARHGPDRLLHGARGTMEGSASLLRAEPRPGRRPPDGWQPGLAIRGVLAKSLCRDRGRTVRPRHRILSPCTPRKVDCDSSKSRWEPAMKTAVLIVLAAFCGPSPAVASEHRQTAPPASNPSESVGPDGPQSRGEARAAQDRTILGIQGTRLTLNGRPTFLLGLSYYGGLGASDESVRRDLDDLRRHGFNWLRVWATWSAFDRDVSAVGPDGGAREPFLGRLRWLVAECARRGLVVDITLTRGERKAGGAIPDYEAHRKAVETVVGALKGHRNWYLDLANERDVRDARHVPAEELKAMRALARKLDPGLPVTASFGGHDLDESDLREALKTIGLDFVAPHRPREAGSPGQTEARTRATLATMKEIGRSAPILYQEPFRRDYGRWEPSADDFLADLDGAIAGGAAGWCFHNGSGRGAAADHPRRSFDLRDRRLFDQLDDEERKVVDRAASRVRRADAMPPR